MLERHSVHVRTVPDMSSLLKGQVTVKDVHEVKVEDLLGREPVAPDLHLLSSSITGKVVLITGAGVSIGSQLARPARQPNPRQLLLLDVSDAAPFPFDPHFFPSSLVLATLCSQLDLHSVL